MADSRTTRTALALRGVMLDAAIAQFAGALIRVYTGAQPATPETAASGTLLVEMTMGTPAFAASATSGNNRLLTANAIAAGVAVATGVAGWFRIFKADGVTALVDGEVGATGDANTDNMELPTTSINTGVSVGVSGYTYTLPMQGT